MFSNTCSGILSSYDIPSKVKGFETSKLIHSFLDSSSINSSNSRLVILLPIYCALKQVLSSFNLVVHNKLVNQISLRILDGSPKSYPLSEIINANSSELISYHVQDALLKDGSEISTYIDSLDLELDKKEIVNMPLGTIGLPKAIQYDSEEDIRLIIQRDECKHLERKPYLSYDPKTKCKNTGKEFDVMRAIDSFLNTEGGLLIIGVDDNKKILGLEADYSSLPGERENFDKFQNYLRMLIRNKYFKNSIVEQLIEIKRSEIDGKDICLIDIRKSPFPIFIFREEQGQQFYIRAGDNSTKIDRMELSDYLKRHFCAGSIFDSLNILINNKNPAS
ncbi:MAG: ATP-binding protein [Candidatus Nitrosopolaris sp.]